MTIAVTPAAAIDAAIDANLAALAFRLDAAKQIAIQARAAMSRTRRNEALGTLLPLEQIIPECDALVRTILLLYRAPDVGDASLPL